MLPSPPAPPQSSGGISASGDPLCGGTSTFSQSSAISRAIRHRSPQSSFGSSRLCSTSSYSAYTTVFQSPIAATRRLMSDDELYQYLVHGLQPPRASQLPGLQLAPMVRDNAAATGERHLVEQYIAMREETVKQLRDLLPLPSNLEERDAASQWLLSNTRAQAEKRRELAYLLGELRSISVIICAGIGRWRRAVRRGAPEIAALPARELVYCSDGVSYLLKMTTDLAFLPLPLLHDPLLMDWFRSELPWMLENIPKLMRRRHSSLTAKLTSLFDASPPVGDAAQREIAEAKNMLLEEAVRCGVSTSLAALSQSAVARARSTDPGIRWQWSAYQLLLYGGESYGRMLRSLSTFAKAKAADAAAIVLQRTYRKRLYSDRAT